MPVPSWPTALKAVAPNVYAYIQGGGPGITNYGVSNAGLVLGPRDALVVDTLRGPIPVHGFLTAMAKVTRKPVRFVVNTHDHPDHTNGNQFFPGAEIIASEAARALYLKSNAATPSVWVANPGVAAGGEPRAVKPPTTTFQGRLRLYLGDMMVELYAPEPAHTLGDVLVYLPREKVLFAGDCCFFYVAPTFSAGSGAGSLHVLDWIEALDVDWIVPGHGPVGTKVELRLNRGYFERLGREARIRFDKGMSAPEAAASIDMGEYKEWPDARDRLIENTVRFYKGFEGQPTEAITPAERQANLAAYLKLLGAAP